MATQILPNIGVSQRRRAKPERIGDASARSAAPSRNRRAADGILAEKSLKVRQATDTTADTPTQSAPRAKSKERVDRLTRSHRNMVTVVTAATLIVCTLLVAYLACYARVVSLGLAQSHSRMMLHQRLMLAETLRSECAAAARPEQIAADAVAMGMVAQHMRVAYVSAPPTGDATPQPLPLQAQTAARPNSAGTVSAADAGAAAPTLVGYYPEAASHATVPITIAAAVQVSN